ncbi:hypothetical protein [Streptomyces rochei]|uniref:hypothetical protein n=1 Tax=Streptomyces rochei TaxID=1928 RepID=UPI003F16DEF0
MAATSAPVALEVESISGPKSRGEANWPPQSAIACNEVAVPHCSAGGAVVQDGQGGHRDAAADPGEHRHDQQHGPVPGDGKDQQRHRPRSGRDPHQRGIAKVGGELGIGEADQARGAGGEHGAVQSDHEGVVDAELVQAAGQSDPGASRVH